MASPVALSGRADYISEMTIRPILIHPDPRLKAKADPIGSVDDELRRLADDMLETMYDAPGIGLAAPQVGVLHRMFVMDCVKDEDTSPQPMVLLNPEIIEASEEMSIYDEGCLSIPDQYAEIERPAEVKVQWTDLDGKTQQERFDGLWATCIQHEIDHLDGKLFIDPETSNMNATSTLSIPYSDAEETRNGISSRPTTLINAVVCSHRMLASISSEFSVTRTVVGSQSRPPRLPI